MKKTRLSPKTKDTPMLKIWRWETGGLWSVGERDHDGEWKALHTETQYRDVLWHALLLAQYTVVTEGAVTIWSADRP